MRNLELPSPADLSGAARACEITAILAAAIVRSQLAEGQKHREIRLGFLHGQSVHTTPYQQEKL